MLFCPTCGNILLIDGSQKYSTMNRLFCRTCPYHIEVNKTVTRKMIPKGAREEEEEILEDIVKSAVTDAKCARCSHQKAYFREMQTRSADEPATLFFKCANEKCGFQWKEG
mmetsp:Transcript_38574/g.61625  ORF Transcript_38574/g.61625 Transcript_38574/m.61625 type:complete len:111 (+) Transcript_38574:28-360(+)